MKARGSESSVRAAHSAWVEFKGREEIWKARKDGLPAIIPSGTFRGRKQAGNWDQPSEVLVLDFDHTDSPGALRAACAAIPYTIAAFISPSGDGVKAFVALDLDGWKPTPDQWKAHVYAPVVDAYEKALMDTKVGTDPTNKNVNRLCYGSSDAGLEYVQRHHSTSHPRGPLSGRRATPGPRRTSIPWKGPPRPKNTQVHPLCLTCMNTSLISMPCSSSTRPTTTTVG